MTIPALSRHDALIALFTRAGYQRLEPPLLMPADLVLDLAGEDLGRQLFMTQDAEGQELCLRPDFTIAVVEAHLGGQAKGGAYCYSGPIFRQKPGESGESQQAGIELLGRTDTAAADAEVTALAVEGVRLYCRNGFDIHMGDIGVFRALIDALELTPAWRRKLIKDFHRTRTLSADLMQLGKGASPQAYAGITAALKDLEPAGARSLIDDVLTLAGITTVGGRQASEIAERFVEQASLASTTIDAGRTKLIQDVLRVEAKPQQALEQLARLTQVAGVSISPALDMLAKRFDLLAKGGIAGDAITFSARFGRGMDYYTGHVFEIRSFGDTGSPPLVGGGRYDRLTDAVAVKLGQSQGTPAVGCAFFLDRLNAKGGA